MAKNKQGKIVVGTEDPFNEKQTSMFDFLMYELQGVQAGETYCIPEKDYEYTKKLRTMVHAVSKALRWNSILWYGKNKSYIVTIKRDGLYIRRLG